MAWNILDDSWTGLNDIPADFQDGKINWNEIVDKPSNYPPSSHTHDYLNSGGISYGTNQSFEIQGLNITYAGGINNNFKNSSSVSGLTQSGATLLEAISAGNLILGLRPNEAGDGFSIIFTDVIVAPSSPANANYTLCKIRIFRGEIFLESSRLILANLPTSANGLASGQIWRDTNGFLKAV